MSGGIIDYDLFAYCRNNPISFSNLNGNCASSVVLTNWFSRLWWVSLLDGPLPIAEIALILLVVLVGATIVEYVSTNEISSNVFAKSTPQIAPEDSDERPLDENGKPVVQPGEAPREEDGYVPPKKGPKWDKEKHGWLDKNGNVWRPQPTGSPRAHGGGHWDVQSPGDGYTNVYPGGLSRGGYKPFPHLPLLH